MTGATFSESTFAPGQEFPTHLHGGCGIYCGELSPFHLAEHQHDELEILLLSEPAECHLTWRAEEKCEQRRLLGGEICFIGSQVPHSVSWLKAASILSVHLPADIAQATSGLLGGIFVHDFRHFAHEDVCVSEIAKALQRSGQQTDRNHPLYIESLATVFSVHALRAHFKSGKTEMRRLTPGQLRKVTAFIESQLKEALSIGEIAQHIHLSPFHFIRLFKNTTGLTPHQYVIKRRVLRAEELLRTGEFRVAEAAYEVGFCDQSHLDRHFRRHFGFPPKILLKRHRAQE